MTGHDHQLDRDALAWLTVKLGGTTPLVPEPVRERGNPSEIIASALVNLPHARNTPAAGRRTARRAAEAPGGG